MPMSHQPKPSLPALALLLVPGLVMACLAAVTVRAAEPALIPNEPGEENPGGSATTQDSIDTREAFSHFSHGIGFEGEAKFKVGNAIFRKLWISAPSSTTSSDGLGPLYNSRSCQSCHLKDGRGHPPAANFPADTAELMFLRLSIPPQNDEQKRLLAEHRVNTINEPTYGEQLQNIAVQGLDNEGHMRIDYKEQPVTLGDGTVVSLRHPTYGIDGLKYGPLHPQTMMSPRVAPPMIGVGLLEAIPEAQIRAHADADDKDKDGISGRTNEVWSIGQNKTALGRFGWKAGKPTVGEQAASAFAGDMGLSTPVVSNPAGDCTKAQPACLNAPNGNTERDGGFEVGDKLFDHVVFYSQNLAVPPRRNFNDPEVARGKAVFYAPRLPELPHAVIHHRRGEGSAASLQSEDLALHRPAAARHGRGSRRQPARRRRRRARVAHGAAVGHRSHQARQRAHPVPARRAGAQRRGSDPVARRRGAGGARWLCRAVESRSRGADQIRGVAVRDNRWPGARGCALAVAMIALPAVAQPAVAFDDAALARQAYDGIILPGYARFVETSRAFADAAGALCKAPSRRRRSMPRAPQPVQRSSPGAASSRCASVPSRSSSASSGCSSIPTRTA